MSQGERIDNETYYPLSKVCVGLTPPFLQKFRKGWIFSMGAKVFSTNKR